MTRYFRLRRLLPLALLAGSALALGGCVAYPGGYYGYPAYGYAGPPVTVGVGGWWGGGWRHDGDGGWGGHDGGWHGGDGDRGGWHH